MEPTLLEVGGSLALVVNARLQTWKSILWQSGLAVLAATGSAHVVDFFVQNKSLSGPCFVPPAVTRTTYVARVSTEKPA
jgi:hypothetical protein